MRLESSIVRCAYVVERALKTCFLSDFDERCMYSAFGMHRLAKRLGHQSVIVAGSFAALTVARDKSQASFQGYAGSEGEYGHYWGEIDGHTVDLGPMFLPVSSRYLAVMAPVIVWPLAKKVPLALNYNVKIRYHTDVKPQMPVDVMERLGKFLGVCDQKFSEVRGQPKLKSWLLTGPNALSSAASEGDPWAIGCIQLEMRSR